MVPAILADNVKLSLVHLVSLLVVLATSIVIARHAGIDTFGLYLFVMSCVSLGTLILTGALDVAVLRHVPRYLGSDLSSQPEQLPHFVRWVALKFGRQLVLLLLVLALVIALAFGAAHVRSWPLSEQFDPLLIAICLALVVVLSCLALLRGFLQGFTARWATLPEQWLHPLLLLGLISSCVLLTSIRTVSQLVGYSLLASLVTLLVAALWSKRQAQQMGAVTLASAGQSPGMNVDDEANRWSAGLTAVIGLAAAQLVLGQGDVLVVGLLRGPIEVAFYGAVVQLLLVFSFGFVVVNRSFAPRYKQLFAIADLPAIARLSRWLMGLTLGSTAVLIVVFWSAAPCFLALFGEAYITKETLLVLRILLVTQLALGVAVLVSYLLVMAGREKQMAVIATMAAVVNLFLNLALVSRLGIVGAAAATAAALCLQSITAWWFARRLGLI